MDNHSWILNKSRNKKELPCFHNSKTKIRNNIWEKNLMFIKLWIDISRYREKYIKWLDAKHSHGHDDVSTILLKEISQLIISPLTLILNQSLSIGNFTYRLKVVKIIPPFKQMVFIILIITYQSHFFLQSPKYLKSGIHTINWLYKW